jgi:solute carrier family 15 (oligopeptide transporter), member 1
VSVGLIVMIVGSGSLKNNLNSFGGSQHKLPEQKRQLEKYFSIQYFGVKMGSMLARVIFPMLREDVKCFGNNDCYVVTFGIPALILIFGMIIFLIGSSQYVRKPPSGNMIVRMAKCIKVSPNVMQGV